MPALAVGMLISTQLATCPFHQRWGKWLFLVEWNQFHGYLRCPGSYRTTRNPPITLVELTSEYLDCHLEFWPAPSRTFSQSPFSPCAMSSAVPTYSFWDTFPHAASAAIPDRSTNVSREKEGAGTTCLWASPQQNHLISSWLVVLSPRAHQGHHWIALWCTAPLLEARPVTLWSSGVLFFSSQNKNHIDSFPEKVSPEKARKTYIAAHLHVFSVFRDRGRYTRSFGKYKGHV